MLRRIFAIALALLALPALTEARQAAEEKPTRLEACGRQNWDPEEYGYDDPCLIALGFDPAIYFADYGDPPGVLEVNALVDAVYWPGLRGVDWAFAIDHSCPGVMRPASPCDFEDRRLLMRAVSWKKRSEVPSDWKWVAPKSKAGAQALLSMAANWREADLQACPGAADKLLALEKVQWMTFDQFDRSWIASGRPDLADLIVVADGDTVITRAGGLETTVAVDKAWDGTPGRWAIEMMELVEPCLKPSTAPPPWRR